MKGLYGLEHCYIVDERYLIAYEIGAPWYQDDVYFLNELLVLALIGGGDFRSVTSFLEGRAREAGCVDAIAGTALAPSDAALASLYEKHGFMRGAISLSKEI